MNTRTGPDCEAAIQARVALFVSEADPLPWTADDWALSLMTVFIIVSCALGFA